MVLRSLYTVDILAAPSIPGMMSPPVNTLAVPYPSNPRPPLTPNTAAPVRALSRTTFAVPARGTLINFGIFFHVHLALPSTQPPILLKNHFDSVG